MLKKDTPNDYYIEGLRVKDPLVIKQIYIDFLPIIRRWVLNNSGNVQDVQDIFQDTFIQILPKVFDSKFVLNYPFGAFFFGVCRNLWLKKLKKKHRENIRNQELNVFINKEDFINITENAQKTQQWHLLLENTFVKLSPLCQEVLLLLKQGLKVKAISKQLDMQANAIYQRKKDCTKRWLTLMQAHSEFDDCNPY